MRTNIYAEEMPNPPRIAIIEKTIDGVKFTGLRIYLELPVTLCRAKVIDSAGVESNADNADIIREAPDGLHAKGPFMHGRDDDDSSAVTFWGKSDLRVTLREALAQLDAHYAKRNPAEAPDDAFRGELASLLNRHSMENGSNTPAHILADFLARTLYVFDATMQRRAQWYGRMDVPGRGSVPYERAPR